jgi:hypothetical protein
MRPLVVDDIARSKVKRVLDHAQDRRNWYRPGKDARVPGDDPRFVAHLDTYRCVFTITDSPDGVFRHLSISIPAALKYPNVFAAFTIAEMFGFTGWDGTSVDLPPNWMARVSTEEHCIVMGQPYLVPEKVA